MVEIILTILCLLLTVLFVAVVAKKYNSSVETDPRRPSKEDTMYKTAERGKGFLESYGASNAFKRSSNEAGSEIIYTGRTKQLNKIDDKRNKSDEKQNKNNEKKNKRDDIGNESDNKEKESVDNGNESDDTIRIIGNENLMEEEYKKFSSFVNEEDLEAEMAKAGTTLGLFQYIRKSLDHWKNRKVNVAVTGNSGTGKSSLVNALRNLKPTDPRAAKVGVVETTTDVRKYTYPNNDQVIISDLPGIGTQSFTRDKYLDKINFSEFDVVIIVTATRFLENDMWLAKEISKLGRYLLFVRTKIDIDMRNSRTDHPDRHETEIMQEIRNNIADNLSKGNLSIMKHNIYLVGSPDQSYDFQNLNATLKSLLNIRGKSICSLLKKYVENAIERKRDMIKNSSWLWKLMQTVRAFPKGFSNGLYLITRRYYDYCLKMFCLDDQSLDKCAKEMSISKEYLREHLKVCTDDCYRWEEPQDPKGLNYFIRRGVRFPIMYFTSDYFLHTRCDSLAESELCLILMRLDKLEKELNPVMT